MGKVLKLVRIIKKKRLPRIKCIEFKKKFRPKEKDDNIIKHISKRIENNPKKIADIIFYDDYLMKILVYGNLKIVDNKGCVKVDTSKNIINLQHKKIYNKISNREYYIKQEPKIIITINGELCLELCFGLYDIMGSIYNEDLIYNLAEKKMNEYMNIQRQKRSLVK